MPAQLALEDAAKAEAISKSFLEFKAIADELVSGPCGHNILEELVSAATAKPSKKDANQVVIKICWTFHGLPCRYHHELMDVLMRSQSAEKLSGPAPKGHLI